MPGELYSRPSSTQCDFGATETDGEPSIMTCSPSPSMYQSLHLCIELQKISLLNYIICLSYIFNLNGEDLLRTCFSLGGISFELRALFSTSCWRTYMKENVIIKISAARYLYGYTHQLLLKFISVHDNLVGLGAQERGGHCVSFFG